MSARPLSGAERLFLAILALVLLVSFVPGPLWRLAWRHPAWQRWCFSPVADAQGRPREAWRWVEGRTIRVSQLPGLKAQQAEEVALGARDLLVEAGLDLVVEVRPMPAALQEAYRQSLRRTAAGVRLSFPELESRVAGLRDGDPHADVLIVDAPVEGTDWAFGMGAFRSGLVVLHQSATGRGLAKHEIGHLVGYMMHDTFPLFVLGYPWEGWPWSRDTLMLLAGRSLELSPRARDALRELWGALERRTGNSRLAPLPG